MQDLEFQKRLWLSSVQLVKLSKNRLPIGIASGCLVDYRGKRLLLTVSHATGDQESWAVQLKYVQGKGTEAYQLGAMNYLAKGLVSKPEFEGIDFAYVEVPPDIYGYRQDIHESKFIVKSETPITVHAPTFLEVPQVGDNFGFCGMIMPTKEKHFGRDFFGGEVRVYSGLSYLRTEGDYDVFLLPFSHPGHEHFRGCSGAPILSNTGAVVALVCNGCEKSNEIFGISVRAFKAPIDILVGNVR